TARTIATAGTVTWTGTGSISSGSGAGLRVEAGGLFDVQADAFWFYNLGGAVPRVDVASGGTLRRSVGTGTATLGAVVNDSGTVQVQTGTLVLDEGGTSTGAFTVASPGILNFQRGTHVTRAGASVTGTGNVTFTIGTDTLFGSYDVTGTTTLASGTVNFSAASPDTARTTTLTLSGGTLQGSGVVLVRTSGSWTTGALGGSGVLQIASGGTLSISGAGAKTFTARTIANAGTVTWTGTGSISSGSAAVLQNQSGGTVDIQADASWFHNLGGGVPTFNNLQGGTVKRSAGTGVANVQAVTNNEGTFDLTSGTLQLANGGTGGGTFTVTSPATLEFSGSATHTLGTTSRVSGTGNVFFTSAAINVQGTAPNAYDVSGTTQILSATVNFNTTDTTRITTLQLRGGAMQGTAPFLIQGSGSWTGGILTGPTNSVLRIPAGVTLTIGGTATKTFRRRTILNAGTVVWTSTGTVASDSSATLDNLAGASFELSGTGFWSSTGVGPPRVEVRSGATMKRTTSTGVTQVNAVVNNAGTLDVQTGTLKFGTSFNNTSGAVLQGSGTLDVATATVTNGGVVHPGTSPG
ncbi:MAG: hypothetical protein HY355_04195, partial [Armatimonadetes bacterium]|nr:hypothetical protein [Armatimonadota bacterium]